MQADIFAEVSDLVQSALDGYKVCLFSYGQTGAGKTHTMQVGRVLLFLAEFKGQGGVDATVTHTMQVGRGLLVCSFQRAGCCRGGRSGRCL